MFLKGRILKIPDGKKNVCVCVCVCACVCACVCECVDNEFEGKMKNQEIYSEQCVSVIGEATFNMQCRGEFRTQFGEQCGAEDSLLAVPSLCVHGQWRI